MRLAKNILMAVGGLLLMASCNDNKDYVVIIHTEYGDMKVILYEETPVHKENFIELAKSGAYDSTKWHRVIPNFMIQGGDIYAKEGGKEPTSDRLPAEIVPGLYHTKGALAAARQGDQMNPQRKSSGAQFYIVDGRKFTEQELTTDQAKLNQSITQMLRDTTQYDSLRQMFQELQEQEKFEQMSQLALESKEYVESELGIDLSKEFDSKRLDLYTSTPGAPHLDNAYTIFGRVVEGLDVIDKIAAVRRNNDDKPLKDTYISMEVKKVPKEEITRKYGYEYPE